jgi:hypothetical protein
MQIAQEIWTPGHAAQVGAGRGACASPQLVLAFASPELVRDPETWRKLRSRWPTAALVAASTAGEICGTRVLDDTVTVTAIELGKTRVRAVRVDVPDGDSSYSTGALLAERLIGKGLRHVFVLSDGLKVNGSSLVRGLSQSLPKGVSVTGGLCGDGSRFERTYVCLGDLEEQAGVVGIGFYGEHLQIGMGSMGGWDPFGPERQVTRSEGNVLFELDGESALALYERYLGEHAAGLPASGLLFPLTVRAEKNVPGVVRTILAVDRERGSLTYAGDVPTGHYARLMRANFDRLVDGSIGAARTSRDALSKAPELAILVSCVGRKLVLKQRIEEEVEGAEAALGAGAVLTGFYSYGEICPFASDARSELHNQTMTVTAFTED